MRLVNVISTEITKGLRLVKARVLGKNDIQTPHQISPFGVDSNPIKDMVAVYSQTSAFGAPVIIGYLNKNNIADVGENRFFSTNESGEEQAYIHLKNDETIEINGNGDFAVRFNALDSSLQAFKSQLQSELALIATGISGAGGAYTPSLLSVDISTAKVDEVKVSG